MQVGLEDGGYKEGGEKDFHTVREIDKDLER